MQFESELISYAVNMSSSEPELLQRLHRETNLKVLYPRMLSDHFQGRFLSLLSKLYRPKRILEIGTFTGYSAICLGEGLPEDGEIHCLEMNAELEFIIRPFIEEAGLTSRVKLHFGLALELLEDIDGPFDMVFIDADKGNYLNYYLKVINMIPSGGIILADNVLWDGKVVNESVRDKETEGIRKFNEYVKQDESVEKVLLPIRDGLFLIRKK
jgi:caffeoyl-CoA O-methyltransferase